MYGYGYRYSVRTFNPSVFTPLSLNPTFWFDFNDYPNGAYSGGGAEVDKTGNYSINPLNSAGNQNDGTNEAYYTDGTTSYAIGYGSSFQSILQNDHTQIFLYKSNNATTTGGEAFCGVTLSGGTEGYNIWRVNDKIRIFLKINNVNQVFNSIADVFTTTDYYYILVQIKSTGVVVEVNGVNITLDNTTFSQPLGDMNITSSFYVGARNNVGTGVDQLADGFIGDHLLIPSALSSSQKTQLLNYFV